VAGNLLDGDASALTSDSILLVGQLLLEVVNEPIKSLVR
jgi:hypothetical protein